MRRSRWRSRWFSGRSSGPLWRRVFFRERGTCGRKAYWCRIITIAFRGCRMIRVFVATIFLGWLVFPAVAARLDAAALNNAEYSSKLSTDSIDAAAIRIQVLLDRARFSPGEIDGKLGENAQKALRAFAEAKGLTSDKVLTAEVWKVLVTGSEDAAIVEYKISESDIKGPFLEKLPAKMDDMKSLKALGYTSPREAIAEKFHMSEGLLEALNPKKKFDQAGEILLVADVLRNDSKLNVDRIEVD